MNKSSVQFGDDNDGKKVYRSGASLPLDKRKKNRKQRRGEQKVNHRGNQPWEYPDVISDHSSTVSSLTGGCYSLYSINRNHLRVEERNFAQKKRVDFSKVSDTEYEGSNTPSLCKTSTMESSCKNSPRKLNERFDLTRGFTSELFKFGDEVTETPNERTQYLQSKSLKHYLLMCKGVIGVIFAIAVITTLALIINKNNARKVNDGALVEVGKEVEQVKLSPREEYLLEILKTVSPYGLEKKNTPQYLAKEWMFHTDILNLVPSLVVSNERIIQRYILAVFYYSTDGPESWKHNNWLDGDECSGIQWTGISCDKNNTISAILLDNFGLQGTLPNELGFLSMMKHIIVKNHPLLVGNIPSTMGRLRMLEQLGLYNNGLTGMIPIDLYLATHLKYINLQNNRLEGEIAVSIEHLRNIEKLVLSDNVFSGKIPFRKFARTKIKLLELSNNKFSGTLPDQISNLPRLKYLHLGNNILSGTVPLNLGRLTNMISLNLNNNNFRGSIPSSFSMMRSLKFFSIFGNTITGHIPIEIASLINLQVLNLGANQISGEIPFFDPDSNLTRIHLLQNNIHGTLPASLGQLKKLEVLFLSSNKLNGIHESLLNDLKDTLQGLYLSKNKFTGFLPDQLCGMVHLKALFLDENYFYGPLPDCIGSLSNLRQLFLFSNGLSGTIPDSLGALRKLSQLGLESNNFQGRVPNYVCSNDALTDIWFDCGGQRPKLQCTCCLNCCPSTDC